MLHFIQEQTTPIASTARNDLEQAPIPDEIFVPPSWTPEGSMFSPEDFRSQLRRNQDVQVPEELSQSASRVSFLIQHKDTPQEGRNEPSALVIDSPEHSPAGKAVQPSTDVPTIMLSNSTAAIPLPFESSLSIAPLAARRGHKGPAPLKLSCSPGIVATPTSDGALGSDGLYPGIPTPFLGSPSAYSPKFEFSQDPTSFSMDLATMCQDLRSRCPPLHPPSPPSMEQTQPVSPLSDSDSSASDPDSSSDTDEWAFMHNLVAELGDSLPPGTLEVEPHPTDKDDSCSWASAPTLTNSPRSDSDDCLPATPDVLKRGSKQHRRRETVLLSKRCLTTDALH